LEKYATKGTKLVIHASAKNLSKENSQVVFRINEFDFCNQDFED
jgi:hypothetical protein